MYVKITSDQQLQLMPDLYRASWDLREDDITREFCAKHDNWLVCKDTPCPEFDPDTHYATSYYVEEDGQAVQHWEIHVIDD